MHYQMKHKEEIMGRARMNKQFKNELRDRIRHYMDRLRKDPWTAKDAKTIEIQIMKHQHNEFLVYVRDTRKERNWDTRWHKLEWIYMGGKWDNFWRVYQMVNQLIHNKQIERRIAAGEDVHYWN